MATKPPRRQCRRCPWKTSTGRNIPNGFAHDARELVQRMVARSASLIDSHEIAQQCHETLDDDPLPCVGWLVNQLGPGNNLPLRLRVMLGQVDANVVTVGPQHRRIEDIVP